MKNKIITAINYLIPSEYYYKFENKVFSYFLLLTCSLLPFYFVYLAEITIQASQNFYWLDHFLFGLAGPWCFGFLCVFWKRHHSFRLGVFVTIFVSLGNEYYFDIIENGQSWELTQQLMHTLSDFLGIFISYLIFRLLLKKTL